MSSLLNHLQEPEVAGCPVDGLARFDAHRRVLLRKKQVRVVFEEFHQTFIRLDQQFFTGEGMTIELGAGVYPVRETAPSVLATDIVPAAHLDRVLDAGAMELADASVRAFYLQNVFHHFPQPSRFFDELERTLLPGGGAILIEPASGSLAAWLYPRLFASEGYDQLAKSWDTPVGGPMSGANQALSYLIFDRDLDRFQTEHPTLEIVHRDVLGNWLRYLLSGGLNFRPLFPAAGTPLLRGFERILKPLRGKLGLHRVIVLRKRQASS
jgi:SAM-dependent methyltransferase